MGPGARLEPPGFCLVISERAPAGKGQLHGKPDAVQEIGNRRGVVYCLSGLGGVAAKIGRPEYAARIFGAIQAQAGVTSMLQYGIDRARFQRTVALAREEIHDESVWNSAYAEGRTMTFEQAMAYAVEATDQ